MTIATISIHDRIRAAMDVFGFTDFRSPEQKKLIEAITDGQDALGIMPTGAGKSACYIIPTLARGMKTVVISPLIALMNDQVLKLREAGVSAFAVNSDTDRFDIIEAMMTMQIQNGRPAFLYASPEMLVTENFMNKFKRMKPDFLAIDEAHCVSTWGEAFRPTYMRIRNIAERFGSPQCAAFSATIDPKIEADVCQRLPLREGFVRVVADPYRKNLRIKVERPGVKQKQTKNRNKLARQRLMQLLREESSGAAIVYCYSRNRSMLEYQAIGDYTRQYGYEPLLFHGSVGNEHKTETAERFLKEPRPVVFCTSAFGMGIDRADVRLVVHFEVPSTLVDYAQQIGRAGRDGEDARCITFFDPARVNRTDASLRRNIPDVTFVEDLYERLIASWRKAEGKLNLPAFQRNVMIQADENDGGAEVYNQRVTRSISILRQAGYIFDKEDGRIGLKQMSPGNERHQKILGLTEMSTRRQLREAERLRQFFTAEQPTQRLMWEIIGK